MFSTTPWLKALLFSICAFLMPVVPAIMLIGAFLVVDTVSGVWAAIKRDEEITSRKLGALVTKALLYQAAVLLAYGMDYVLLGGSGIVVNIENVMTKMVLMAIIFIESKSIDENIYTITGKSILEAATQALSRAVKIKDKVSGL